MPMKKQRKILSNRKTVRHKNKYRCFGTMLALLMLFAGCSKSEVIMQKEIITKAQDSTYNRQPDLKDTASQGKPIAFNITIENGEELWH